MDMIKLLIFDVGGVLDTFDESQYIRYMHKKHGLDPIKFRSVLIPLLDRMEVGKVSLVEAEKIMEEKFGINNHQLEWNRAFNKLNRVNKSVIALVDKLSENYKIVLLTNVSRSRHIVKMERYLEKVKCNRVIASCYVKMHKPEHRIYRYTLKQMNVKASEAIFIDNLKRNVKGAREVGIRSIHYKNYNGLVKNLKKFGVQW
jgi:HAD superfamily hydrolase (TIGR01509 family)